MQFSNTIATGVVVASDAIIYEQPLNEQIRLCLRLEYLFQRINHYLERDSSWDAHATLISIIEVLNVIDRPDLKNKFGQALNQYAQSLNLLEKLPNIDKKRLDEILTQIDKLLDRIHSNQGKMGQELRENEFLAAIQQRLYTPAGTCAFSIPSYHLWLTQSQTKRTTQLESWTEHFKLLQEIIKLMLKITRESASFKTLTAPSGFYQSNLDPNVPFQLIRISVMQSAQVYPEISVGRHRLSIHFFGLNATGKASQTKNDISFDLACCKI